MKLIIKLTIRIAKRTRTRITTWIGIRMRIRTRMRMRIYSLQAKRQKDVKIKAVRFLWHGGMSGVPE